jgi:hypothetical protein
LRRGTRGYSETRDGDGNNVKKKGVVDAGGRRDSRQSAVQLMVLHRKLCDSLFGSQSTVAPPVPTAVDFVASLPEAAPVFATPNRPLFPRLPRLLDSTEIFTFLSRHHPYPIGERKAIHRECAEMLSWIGTRGKGAHVENRPLGNRSRRKDILQPFRLFYSLGCAQVCPGSACTFSRHVLPSQRHQERAVTSGALSYHVTRRACPCLAGVVEASRRAV